MKFNAKTDISAEALKDRAQAEAMEIYSKGSTRRGRSFNEIVEVCMYGHAAEVYLIEKEGYRDDPRPYKDVIDPNGEPVEVKVTEGDYYVPYVLDRCNKAAKDSWRKYPKKLIIFVNNKRDLWYNKHAEYVWNGKEFVESK